MRQPYIKPTRYIHDSGFFCFEVGYILKIDDKNRVTEKQVLGKGSDHIYQDYSMLSSKKEPFSLNMDLTRDGHIRLFTHKEGKTLAWEDETCFSSMGLILVDKPKV